MSSDLPRRKVVSQFRLTINDAWGYRADMPFDVVACGHVLSARGGRPAKSRGCEKCARREPSDLSAEEWAMLDVEGDADDGR